MPNTSSATDKSKLREHFRQTRQALSTLDQVNASQALFRRLANSIRFRRANSIAGYLANDGEISPKILLEQARRMGKDCYLPVTLDNQRMAFRLFNKYSRLRKNQYGILEPDSNCHEISPQNLDLVFLPLVAFDAKGNRLGMGGGYYDRAFSFKRKALTRGPILIGLAHSCQQAIQINAENWDITLDHIATDQGIIKRTRSKSR